MRRRGSRAGRGRRALRGLAPGAALAALTGALLLPGGAGGQVSARAYVDRTEVGVNRTFTVTIEVSGVQQLDAQPRPPALGQFAQYLRSGTSTSIQVINGRTRASTIVQFTYLATRVGSYQIPVQEVQADGQTLRTAPIAMTVTDSPLAGGEIAPGVPSSALFLLAEANKRRVYPNEPVTVEYRLFTQVDITSFSTTSPPGTEGF
ncbi:MAG TPA: BatD family protein, partial [Longimicrobiales bacterium]|nr:BatD family protein [Longimicrobiales bacterium]